MISPEDAGNLLNKLIAESIPVVAMFVGKDGTTAQVSGIVQGLSSEGELAVVSSREDITPSYLRVLVSNRCIFSYGDKREIAEERREFLSQKYGDSVLVIFLETGGILSLFFTL